MYICIYTNDYTHRYIIHTGTLTDHRVAHIHTLKRRHSLAQKHIHQITHVSQGTGTNTERHAFAGVSHKTQAHPYTDVIHTPTHKGICSYTYLQAHSYKTLLEARTHANLHTYIVITHTHYIKHICSFHKHTPSAQAHLSPVLGAT